MRPARYGHRLRLLDVDHSLAPMISPARRIRLDSPGGLVPPRPFAGIVGLDPREWYLGAAPWPRGVASPGGSSPASLAVFGMLLLGEPGPAGWVGWRAVPRKFDFEVERAGEEEALAEVALFALEGLELGLVLDSFAERLEAERLAELDERVDERAGFLRGGDAGDEGAVDLERVDGELAEVGEGAVAGAEVVDRDAHAECLEGGEAGGGLVDVLHERGLGDLERQRGGVEAAVVERLAHVVEDRRCRAGAPETLTAIPIG